MTDGRDLAVPWIADTFGGVLERLKEDWQNPKKRRRFHKHALAALREIGVLLVAFAPLDMALSTSGSFRWGRLVLFLVFGVLAFVVGAVGEWRFDEDDS